MKRFLPQRTQKIRRRIQILASGLVVFFAASVSAQPTTAPASQPAFEVVGQINVPALRESSGLVASRRYPGVFWTHNDSGNSSTLYAITREGKLLTSFTIDAPNVDWEDIAIDDAGHIYLADIGNNTRNRSQVQVYCIPEPDPQGTPSNRPIKPDRLWRLIYPGRPFDAESLCIHDKQGYVIEKDRDGSQAGVYRFSLEADEKPVDLEHVATLSQRIPITGADISADGRWMAIMTLAGPSIYEIDGQIKLAEQPATHSAVFLDPSVESVCFAPGGLLASTEGRRMIYFPFAVLGSNK